MNLPQVVSHDAWQAASAELLAKEKAATRARDALNAERRRMPMAKIDKQYILTPLGRQEEWEDSPARRPQTPPYQWWRRHDKYAS